MAESNNVSSTQVYNPPSALFPNPIPLGLERWATSKDDRDIFFLNGTTQFSVATPTPKNVAVDDSGARVPAAGDNRAGPKAEDRKTG